MEAARGNWRRLWDPPFLPYKAFYFLLLASKACLIPFLPPYYRDKGLSPQQVGVLSALMPLTMIPSQPLWGALADATGKHRLIHASTTLLGSIGRALISVTPARMVYLVTVVFLSNWLAAPALAMGDSATNTKIERLGRESSEYGKQRLWGAISWGWVFAPGMGAFITYANGNAKDYGPFVAHAVFALATAIASTRLEHTSYRSSRKGLAATKGMAADVAAVLLRAEVIVHYLVFLVMACSMGAVDGFLFVYIQDLGGTRLVMGLALTFTCLSEVKSYPALCVTHVNFHSHPVLPPCARCTSLPSAGLCAQEPASTAASTSCYGAISSALDTMPLLPSSLAMGGPSFRSSSSTGALSLLFDGTQLSPSPSHHAHSFFSFRAAITGLRLRCFGH